MGDVFRAFDERLERPVALKRIRPEASESPRARQRFRREARSAALLNHPSIVKLHDIVSDNEGDWIVMELVEGQTLARLLDDGPLEPRRALALAIDLTQALSAAHAEGILHRDLKAKNVLITPRDRVKILDFGLAKQVFHRDGRSTSITADGQIVGTPHAMSPEQAMGRKVDLRSDLFSLGSLLYEMFVGRAPFRGNSPVESLNRVCTHHPPDLHGQVGELPKGLPQLVAWLLEKDPAHRPQTALEVVATLEKLADAPTGSSTVQPPARSVAGKTLETLDPSRPASERRPVAVLCCELVSDDDSSNSLDPEVVYGSMETLENRVREVAEAFEAHVGHALGHRLVIYFGYPQAHEDDTRRAVRAALELAEGCESLATGDRHPVLRLRSGIHTGPAVVMRSASQEQLALGRTLDHATALRKAARPGEILVSNATWRSISSDYRAEALDKDSLGEGSLVQAAHRILGPADFSSQWQAMDSAAPLVARIRELELLDDRFTLARQGAGQAVLVSGEAGIGKSRLVHALRDRLASREPRWLHAQCSSFALNTPLGPITTMLRSFFGLSDTQSAERQSDQLSEELASHGADQTETMPLLTHLLGLPLPERYQPLSYSPQKQRQLTLDLIVELLLQVADRRAVGLVVEDLHWVDPSTLEFLTLLLDRLVGRKLFVLLTFRGEFEPPWQSEEHLTRVNLSRLAGSDVQALIDQVTGGKSLPDDVREQIHSKTDGVPLFVEELTRDLLESGQLVERNESWEPAEPLSPLKVPGTLLASLSARLDRQGSAREVAQLASVIGREFSHRLLAAVSPLDGEQLNRELERLVESKLIQRKGFSSRVRYLFRHALIQDAAYDSLLKAQRQRFHRKIVETLETEFPNIADHQPERLARHYSEAELFELAAKYWHQAGQGAHQRSANREAISHLEQGLTLVDKISHGLRRDQQEMVLQVTLGKALGASRGFSDSRVEDVYRRALQICSGSDGRQGPLMSEKPEILRELGRHHLAHGDFHSAEEVGHQLLEFEEDSNSVLANEARLLLAETHYFYGRHSDAKTWLLTCLESAQEDERGPGLLMHGTVVALGYLADVSWNLGLGDQAVQYSRESISLAESLNHPLSQAFAQTFSSNLLQRLGKPSDCEAAARRAIQISSEKGYFWHAMANITLGWSLAAKSMASEGLPSSDPEEYQRGPKLMRSGYEGLRGFGMRVAETYQLGLLAEVTSWGGDLQKVETYLRAAEEAANATGERFWLPEIHRLRADSIFSENSASAEQELSIALELARAQGSKILELRAALSRGRVWKTLGREHEGRSLVAAVLDEFTEGYDLVDYQEARHFVENGS